MPATSISPRSLLLSTPVLRDTTEVFYAAALFGVEKGFPSSTKAETKVQISEDRTTQHPYRGVEPKDQDLFPTR